MQPTILLVIAVLVEVGDFPLNAHFLSLSQYNFEEKLRFIARERRLLRNLAVVNYNPVGV